MPARKSVSIVIGVVGVLAAALTFLPLTSDNASPTEVPKTVQGDPSADQRPALLVIGDSLSAGYGLERVEEGWVALLQARIDTEDYGIRVVNASISGDTTQGGAARIGQALAAHRPEVVVIELGGNDGLRGIPIDVTEANLRQMVTASQQAGASVAMLGMRIPPNYGPRYTEQFEGTFRKISEELEVPMEPFFLEGVALDPNLMQADGIHPNAGAQSDMLERAWPVIRTAMERADLTSSETH